MLLSARIFFFALTSIATAVDGVHAATGDNINIAVRSARTPILAVRAPTIARRAKHDSKYQFEGRSFGTDAYPWPPRAPPIRTQRARPPPVGTQTRPGSPLRPDEISEPDTPTEDCKKRPNGCKGFQHSTPAGSKQSSQSSQRPPSHSTGKDSGSHSSSSSFDRERRPYSQTGPGGGKEKPASSPRPASDHKAGSGRESRPYAHVPSGGKEDLSARPQSGHGSSPRPSHGASDGSGSGGRSRRPSQHSSSQPPHQSGSSGGSRRTSQHSSSGQHHTGAYQQHPGAYQQYPGAYQQYPGAYQQYPGAYQQHAYQQYPSYQAAAHQYSSYQGAYPQYPSHPGAHPGATNHYPSGRQSRPSGSRYY